MYRNAFQRGMLTVFFSVGSKPLNLWETHTQNGYISRFMDQDIKSMVLEIGGTNVSTTYMTCPKGNDVLGITMPFLVMIVKNLKKYFTFEVTILDETGTRRRFRVSNFQSSTQINPLCTVMPIGLSDGWNQIQFNLAEFTRRAYKKQFVEVQKLKINANIRLRRIYFTERLIPENQLPPEYKLYFPLETKGAKGKKAIGPDIVDTENIQTAETQAVVPPIEEQKEESKTEEEKRSKTEVVKASSKVSVQSVKRLPSKSIAKLEEVPEGKAPPGSKRTSATSVPAVAEGQEISAEGEQPAEPAPERAAEGPPAEVGAPVEEGAPAPEEAPAPAEGEPPAAEPAPELEPEPAPAE